MTMVFATVPLLAAAEDFGTIGIRFEQLYDDAQAGKHGPLVVLDVVEGLSGAKAGVHKGDIVFAIDGALVMGRDLDEINRKTVRGPVGSTVRLSFVRLDSSQYELTLTRMAYPPQINPASDPFAYSIPGSCAHRSKVCFPTSVGPLDCLSRHRDVAFSPDFDFTDSPEYHSYLFFWWLDGTPTITPKQFASDMVAYFQGLAEQRGHNHGFKPDPSNVSATYGLDPAGSHTLGGARASSFQGVVSIYDAHGKIIILNSEVVTGACPGSNHTVAFVGMSMQPRQEGIWKSIDAVRDNFRCSR